MVLALHLYCGDNVKHGLLSKHLFSKKAIILQLKTSQSNDKLLQKQWLPVIKWNKKHSSKQVVSITCTLEEKFSTAATFEGLRLVSFEAELKNLSCTLVCMSLLCISRRDTKQILFRRYNLISYIQIFSLMCQSVNIVANIDVPKYGI